MKIGIVLSSGMVRGALQLGALTAIREYFSPEEISAFSCSSVGALNGYAFATDRLSAAKQLWLENSTNNSRLLIHHAVQNGLFQNAIGTLCNAEDRLQSHFYVTLLNYKKRTVEYADLCDAAPALYPAYLKASVSMVVYNRPVQIGGKSYYDGAVIDNTPVYPLYEKELDYILCLYFDDCGYAFENEAFDKKVIRIPLPLQRYFRETFVLEKDSVEAMLARGYAIAKQTLDTVFRNGTQDVEYIQKIAALLYPRGGRLQYRQTSEVVV